MFVKEVKSLSFFIFEGGGIPGTIYLGIVEVTSKKVFINIS